MSKMVVLINGSMNRGHSLTKRGLQEIETIIKQKGFETRLIEIKDLDLPLFEPNYQHQPPEAMRKLIKIIEESDACIIGSPEYHGGYTGAIKNVIDYFSGDLFKDKPVALLSTSGGYRDGINTLNGLRLVFRNLYARVITEQVAISAHDVIKDEQGNTQFVQPISDKISEVANGIIREITVAATVE